MAQQECLPAFSISPRLRCQPRIFVALFISTPCFLILRSTNMATPEKGTLSERSIHCHGTKDTACPELHEPSLAFASNPWLNPNLRPSQIIPSAEGVEEFFPHLRNLDIAVQLRVSPQLNKTWHDEPSEPAPSKHWHQGSSRGKAVFATGRVMAAGLEPCARQETHTRVSGWHFGPPPLPLSCNSCEQRARPPASAQRGQKRERSQFPFQRAWSHEN